MGYIIKISTDNAAFDSGKRTEVARILRDVAERLERGRDIPFALYDINGNAVGEIVRMIDGD